MKKNLKFLIFSLISLILLYSCQKESDVPTQSATTLKQVEESQNLNFLKESQTNTNLLEIEKVENYPLSDNFKNKIKLNEIEKEFGKLNTNNSQRTILKNRKDISYVIIPFQNSSNSLFVYLNDKGKITPFIFESNFKDAKNGTFYIKDVENNVVIQEIYSDGKLVLNDKNGRVKKENECYACVTAGYNIMKNACESDPICDIACELASVTCKATFLTTALATCTSGSCSPACPCNPFQ